MVQCRAMKWMRRSTVWISATAIGGFVLWLAGTAVSIRVAEGESAGTLFGAKIPFSAFSQARQAVLHQAILTYGDQYRERLTEEETDSQAWDWLTFLHEARAKRIQVSDEAVVRQLRNLPLFQIDGKFNPAAYEQIVRYLGVTARTFEEEFRQELTIKKLLDQITGGITVSDGELKEGFHQREDTIQVSFLRLPSEELAREIFEAARQDGAQLEEAATQLDQKLIRTDYFKRSGKVPDTDLEGSRFSPAFSLEPKEVTGPLPAPEDTWLVLRLEDHRPADEENLASMTETLEKELLAQKRFKVTIDWYQDLFKRANLKKTAVNHKPHKP